MTNKILVTENISLEISYQKIEVITTLPFHISSCFEWDEDTLDPDGNVLGRNYFLNLSALPKELSEYLSKEDIAYTIKIHSELKKFFEFVENNRFNLFEMAGYSGELEL